MADVAMEQSEEIEDLKELMDQRDGCDLEEDETSEAQSAALAELARSRFEGENIPDCWNFKSEVRFKVEELEDATRTHNDYFLENFQGSDALQTMGFLEKYKHFKKVPIYDKEKKEFTPFADEHMPEHGMTEGGKGLGLYPNPVMFTTAQMSQLVNVSIAMGCFDLTSDTNTVETPEGIKSLSEIINNGFKDKVKTPEGDFVDIVGFMDQGVQDVFEYVDEEGTPYRVTDSHPFTTIDENGEFMDLPISEIFRLGLPIVKM